MGFRAIAHNEEAAFSRSWIPSGMNNMANEKKSGQTLKTILSCLATLQYSPSRLK